MVKLNVNNFMKKNYNLCSSRTGIAYRSWDELNNAMPDLLHNNDFRDALNNISLLDPSGIRNGPELDRSMRQFSKFANAYVNWGEEPVKSIPRYNETPSFDGFIVYGHLVLTLCNIVLLE